MNIRKYCEDDYKEILEIYSKSKLDELQFEDADFELLPLESDEKRLSQLMESDIFVYSEKKVIGYTAVYGSEIRALFVHPNNRRKGIGRKLLEHVLTNLEPPVTLYIAKTNHYAKNIYFKYGFEVVEEFKTTYNGKSVLANKMVLSSLNG